MNNPITTAMYTAEKIAMILKSCIVHSRKIFQFFEAWEAKKYLQ